MEIYLERVERINCEKWGLPAKRKALSNAAGAKKVCGYPPHPHAPAKAKWAHAQETLRSDPASPVCLTLVLLVAAG